MDLIDLDDKVLSELFIIGKNVFSIGVPSCKMTNYSNRLLVKGINYLFVRYEVYLSLRYNSYSLYGIIEWK